MSKKSHTTPTSGYEVITPDAAKAMMKLNTNNRAITDSRVAAYSEEMRSGKWQLTHEGIAFGADGTLYDGQHRLAAIVQANVPITLYVTRGLSPDARVVINTGRSRTAVDNLAIVEGIKLSKAFGAAFNVIWQETIGLTSGRNATAAELRITLAANRAAHKAMGQVFVGTKRGLGRSGFVGAFIYAYRENPSKVTLAAQRFYEGTELAAGSPMYALREKALRGGHSDGRADFRRALGAIAADLDGVQKWRVAAKTETSPADNIAIQRFAKAHQGK